MEPLQKLERKLLTYESFLMASENNYAKIDDNQIRPTKC